MIRPTLFRSLAAPIAWVLLVAAAHAQEGSPENWPQFRGPNVDGVVADDARLPETWSTTENVRWKTDVPGDGWSSPVVWGDRVFLTSVINAGGNRAPGAGLYVTILPAETEHRWMIYCFDFETGAMLWEKEVHRGLPNDALHAKNTYASETPVTDGESLYVYFGNLGLFALDFEGEILWDRPLGYEATKRSYGPAASPALDGDRLFIVRDVEGQSFIAAIDKNTGQELWRLDRDEPTTWATPYVWRHEARTEIVTVAVNRVRSYSPAGALLWELGGLSRTSVPTPFTAHGMIYVASGLPSRRDPMPVYAIRPGASGDITLGEGETSNEFIAWTDQTAAPYVPSVIVYGDYYYTALDQGFFLCQDARTGEPVYGRQRISASGANFSASPFAYNGKIFLPAESGETFVVKPGPEFEILGVNDLNEMTMASPAIVRGDLLIRTAGRLYRIGK